MNPILTSALTVIIGATSLSGAFLAPAQAAPLDCSQISKFSIQCEDKFMTFLTGKTEINGTANYSNPNYIGKFFQNNIKDLPAYSKLTMPALSEVKNLVKTAAGREKVKRYIAFSKVNSNSASRQKAAMVLFGINGSGLGTGQLRLINNEVDVFLSLAIARNFGTRVPTDLNRGFQARFGKSAPLNLKR
ncbi:MAG: hypothetical protein ACRCXZ_07385 [Patescibacteria group bacterium]